MSAPVIPSPLPPYARDQVFYYGTDLLRVKNHQLQIHLDGLWYDCEAVNDGGTITFQISQTPE